MKTRFLGLRTSAGAISKSTSVQLFTLVLRMGIDMSHGAIVGLAFDTFFVRDSFSHQYVLDLLRRNSQDKYFRDVPMVSQRYPSKLQNSLTSAVAGLGRVCS